jgi:hypothetical protein
MERIAILDLAWIGKFSSDAPSGNIVPISGTWGESRSTLENGPV